VALREIRNLSLADQVFEQIGREVMTGQLAAGTQLPPERTLVKTFGVNRHVVREALKRLEQIGLIKIAQGGGTLVLDFKRSAGLDLLALMAEHAHAEDADMTYWLAVHEMRAALATDAVKLCARRASQDAKAEIVAAAERMTTASDADLFALEIRFWEHVIDGADNIAYRLAYNSLLRAVLAPAAVQLAEQWTVYEIKEAGYRLGIANAIAAGDAASAEAKTRESMNLVVDLLRKHPAVASRHTASPTTSPARVPRAAAKKRPERAPKKLPRSG
jgi:DNA-binding FadR family transcriptional regulator